MKRFVGITVLEEDEHGHLMPLITIDLPNEASRKKYYRLLKLLSDTEILSGVPLELPRESKGTWIVFALDDRHVLGLFNKGNPKLWHQGLCLGHLYVARVMIRSDVNRLIEEGKHPLA